MTEPLDPFLPLGLPGSHLDAIEGLLARRRALSFERRVVAAPLARVRARLAAHERALLARRNETRELALERLASVVPHEAAAAAWVLVRVAPESVVDAQGNVALPPRPRAHVARALESAPHALVVRLRPDAADLLLPRAMAGLVSVEELCAKLASNESEVRAAACWAAGWMAEPAALPLVLRLVCGPRGVDPASAEGPAAVFALGRLLGQSPHDASVSGLIDVVWGDDVFVTRSTLLVASLFGHVALGHRIARRADASGATEELVFAWALLGLPRFLPAIAACGSSKPRAALAAVHALTGVAGDATDPRPDVPPLSPWPTEATARAVEHSATLPHQLRHHLGRPIDADASEASAVWLRAMLTGQPAEIPFWIRHAPETVAPTFHELAPMVPPWQG